MENQVETETVATEEVKVCKLCGKRNFNPYSSQGEKEFFAQNGLAEPKKCPMCRKIEKVVRLLLEKEYGKSK